MLSVNGRGLSLCVLARRKPLTVIIRLRVCTFAQALFGSGERRKSLRLRNLVTLRTPPLRRYPTHQDEYERVSTLNETNVLLGLGGDNME